MHLSKHDPRPLKTRHTLKIVVNARNQGRSLLADNGKDDTMVSRALEDVLGV
jgi:hypothetical protein